MPWGGPYVPHTWITGDSGTAARLNNIESQYALATTTFEQDIISPFVLTGLVASKDGTNANQLDVTSGVAFLLQTDSTVARQSIASSSGPLTTSAFTTTYYLYLEPNGTYYFNTANTPPSNSLAIAQVTTDGSGNILTVTDERQLNTTLFSQSLGSIAISGALRFGPPASSVQSYLTFVSASSRVELAPPLAGVSAKGIDFAVWNGSSSLVPFAIGAAYGGAPTYIDTSGNYNSTAAIVNLGGQASTGSFGVPVIVKDSTEIHVVSTSVTNIVSYTIPATGMYRVSSFFKTGNAAPSLTMYISFTSHGVASINIPLRVGNSVISGLTGLGNTPYSTESESFEADVSTTFILAYQNTGSTPSDFVRGIVERLA